jgi:adenylosuccinate synthase
MLSGVVLALSGPVGAGKTTLANGVQEACRVRIVSTQSILRERGDAATRRDFQALGEELDREEGGIWVARPVFEILSAAARVPVVVDAIRTHDQLAVLRSGAIVKHIHLTADDHVLEQRYERRRREHPGFELPTFDALRANRTEAVSDALALDADLVLDSGALDIPAVRRRAIELLPTAGTGQRRFSG